MLKSVESESAVLNLKNINVINSLRGIASIMVCLYHIIYEPHNFLQGTWIYNNSVIGAYGVQIFFVITGVVIPLSLINADYSYRLFGRFILKRTIRIEPPYLLSILSWMLFLILRNITHPQNLVNLPTAKDLILHIGYLIPFAKESKWIMGVYWTLAIEFQFYLLISLIFPLLVSRSLFKRLFVYLILFSGCIFLPRTDLMFGWIPVFMLGIIYVSWIYKKIESTEFGIIVVISIILSCKVHNVGITVASCSTLMIIHFFRNYKNSIGEFLGKISYSLYLTHWVVGIGAINVMSKHVTGFYTKLIIVLVSLIISILSAYIFYLLIEKNSKRFASKISLKEPITA